MKAQDGFLFDIMNFNLIEISIKNIIIARSKA